MKKSEKYNLRELEERKCCLSCIAICPIPESQLLEKLDTSIDRMVCDAWRGDPND